MVLTIGLAVSSIIAIRLDCIAVHYWDIPDFWDYQTAFQWLYIMGVIYNPIVSFVKLSVLVFILRFSGVRKLVRYTVWGTGIFNVLTMIATFMVMLLDCVPFAKNWDMSLEGHCVDSSAFALATGSISIVTDAVNILLPFYIFASLEVSLRRKLGLVLVFSLGILAMIFSCVRLYYINAMVTSTDPDVNYSLTTVYSAIEVNLAIWAASAPALWPLVRGHVQRSQDNTRDYYVHIVPKYHGRRSGWIRTNGRSDTGSSHRREPIFEMGGMDKENFPSHANENRPRPMVIQSNYPDANVPLDRQTTSLVGD